MNNYMKNIGFERFLAWFVFLYFIRILLDRLLALYNILIGRTILDYRIFDISDWLINYKGGFIRRGLMGQILWEIEQLHLYDVRMAISIICLFASIVLLFLVLRVFKEEGWSFLILPTGFIFGFTLFRLGGRRDMLSLLLTYVLFFLFEYIVYRPGKKSVGWLLFYLISLFQILMHEASFFYVFPILMLTYLMELKKNQKSFCKNSLLCLLHFVPIFLTMAAVCLFKGDPLTAEIIWNSWEKVFSSFPCNSDTTVIGEGVDALTWGTKDTFVNHLKASYIGSHSPSYMLIPLSIFNLLASYLLVSRINTVDMGIIRKRQMNNVLMSNILLIQFIAMIPMFTILSCDWGRTIPYWLLSSMFFYHIYKNEKIDFLCLTKVSQKIQKGISQNRILSNNYTYIILTLLTPIPWSGAPFDFANTFQQGMIKFLQNDLDHFIAFFS